MKKFFYALVMLQILNISVAKALVNGDIAAEIKIGTCPGQSKWLHLTNLEPQTQAVTKLTYPQAEAALYEEVREYIEAEMSTGRFNVPEFRLIELPGYYYMVQMLECLK